MKMILGAGTIANYMSYISNCKLGQWPYKIPVTSLADVQLYAEIGPTKPGTALYQLIHTCAPNQGQVDTLSLYNYVVGQNTSNQWYGVWRNFSGSTPSCFVIAITLDSQIFFSEEYCVETSCNPLTFMQGCYGHLDNLISYDAQGIYFGVHAGPDVAMGDALVYYKHQLYLRSVELSLSAIKNSFKQGRTRNFRTEKQRIYQFYGEFIPEWYLAEIDSVFNRGEVYVGAQKYLVDETAFEKIEDCKRAWKPTATFKDSFYESFSCEPSPCDPLPAKPCCDPVGVTAYALANTCCTPTGVSASASVGGG